MRYDACPVLVEWREGPAGIELNPGEIRVWLVDLDSGLSPDEVDTAEPGPELDVLSDDERSAPPGLCGHVTVVGSHAAGRRCAKFWGASFVNHPARCGFGRPDRANPSSISERWAQLRVMPAPTIRFNVSHSSDLALIGVCRGHELGVDLERIKRISEADRIVASFFSPAERAEFATIPDDVKALAFFRGWTRKEAVLKGLGIGLAGLAAHYETGFGTTELPAYFIPATPSPRVEQWQLWEAAPRAGFVATVAVRVPLTADSAEPARRGAGGVVACPGEDAVH